MVKVNGKKNNYAVNLSQSISINWSEHQLSQSQYKLTVRDVASSTTVFQEKKIINNPYTSIKHIKNSYSERRKFEIILEIENEEGELETISKVFYSENNSLQDADWITRRDNPIEKEKEYYKDKPNILLSKKFIVDNFDNAEMFLDISGLGYYDVKVNGEKITDVYLNNDVTKYEEIVYYDTYIINNFIKNGENTIEVELANGWYNPAPMSLLGKYNVRNQLTIGRPCLIAQISSFNEEKHKRILNTDNTWKSNTGCYLFDNVFIGEKIALRDFDIIELERETDCQTMKLPGPSGRLVPSTIPKIKRTKKHSPTSIKKVDDGILVTFDQVISGHFLCTIYTDNETNITIKYGESINGDQIDYTSSSPGTTNPIYSEKIQTIIQKDQLQLKEGVNYFENKFTYHSFRYVFIETKELDQKNITDIYAYSTHTNMKSSSTFETSNEWFNNLYQVSIDTKLNNIHSYYEDCPREKLGYGGDIVGLIESQITSFESKEMLDKVLLDFEMEQSKDGGLTQTAPYIGIQTHGASNRAGSLGWQYVIPTILKKVFNYYNRPSGYLDKLPLIERHLNYLLSFDFNYIKTCGLGDWGSIDTVLVKNKETPPDKEFCTAIFYLLLLKDYNEILLGYDKLPQGININKLRQKINVVEDSIIEEFYNEDGYFGEGSQSSYVFALKANIDVDIELLYNNFINKLEKDHYILRSGIFGMSWSYEMLRNENQHIIFEWLNRRAYPSFYKMLENGNKILPEYFTEDSEKYLNVSKNHAMFSSYQSWFIKNILGINYYTNAKDENRLKLNPYYAPDLEYAKGSLMTPNGLIKVHWKKKEENVELKLILPKSITLDKLQGNIEIQTTDNGFNTEYNINNPYL